jgi:hypothetical protein
MCRLLKREFEAEEVNVVLGWDKLVSGSPEVKMSTESSSVGVKVSVESGSISLVRDAILEAREASCFVVSLMGRVFVIGCPV